MKSMVSKRKILAASIGFIFNAGVFVVLPLAFLYYSQQSSAIPAVLTQLKTMVGIDVNSIAVTVAIAGAVMTGASLIADLTESRSFVNLAAKIASSLLGLFIFLNLIGLGDVASMGYLVKTISIEQQSVGWILDLKFFASAMVVIVVAELIVSLLEYLTSKTEKPTE